MEWYGHHNSTSAIFSAKHFLWAFSWSLIYVIFLWFVLTSRSKKRQTLFLGTITLSSGALLSLGILDCNWMTGEGIVQVTQTRWNVRNHGKSEMLTEGLVSVHIGLRNINVTFQSINPDKPFFYYNEQYELRNRQRQDKEQFIYSLHRGLPNPILAVIEFLQHNTCNDTFEQTGFLVNYFLRACFLVWMANQIIFLMIPDLSARVSFINGFVIIFTTTWYIWSIKARYFVIHIEGNKIPVSIGRSFYCTVAAALLQTFMYLLVKLGMDFRISFEVDYDTPWDKEVIQKLSNTALELSKSTLGQTSNSTTESILKSALAKNNNNESTGGILKDISLMKDINDISSIKKPLSPTSTSDQDSTIEEDILPASVVKPPSNLKLDCIPASKRSSPTQSTGSTASSFSRKSVTWAQSSDEDSPVQSNVKPALTVTTNKQEPATPKHMNQSSPEGFINEGFDVETPRRVSPPAGSALKKPIVNLVFANVIQENERTSSPGRSRRASVATESASRYNRPPSMLEWRRGAQPASSTLSFPRRRDTVNHGGSNRKQVLLADEWVVDEPATLEKLSHEPGDKALDRKAPSPPVAHSDCDKKMPSPIQHKSPPKAVSQVDPAMKAGLTDSRQGSAAEPRIHALPRRRHTVSDGLGGLDGLGGQGGLDGLGGLGGDLVNNFASRSQTSQHFNQDTEHLVVDMNR